MKSLQNYPLKIPTPVKAPFYDRIKLKFHLGDFHDPNKSLKLVSPPDDLGSGTRKNFPRRKNRENEFTPLPPQPRSTQGKKQKIFEVN